MDKFKRNYILTAQENTDRSKAIQVKPPLTLEFNVTRNVLSSQNIASLRVYNLSEQNRSEIRKDVTSYGYRKDISLIAGYGNTMGILMSGQVTQAWSIREGLNFVTTIECFDAGYAYANATIEKSWPGGTTRQNVVNDIVQSLKPYGVKKGSISTTLVEGSIPRGEAHSDNPINIMKQYGPGAFFIDNGVANFLQDNEVTDDPITVINSNTGLLGTPLREQFLKIKINMLFDPRFKLGSRVRLESSTDKTFKGIYKVTAIKHSGIISEATSGTATTALELFGGNEALLVVNR